MATVMKLNMSYTVPAVKARSSFYVSYVRKRDNGRGNRFCDTSALAYAPAKSCQWRPWSSSSTITYTKQHHSALISSKSPFPLQTRQTHCPDKAKSPVPASRIGRAAKLSMYRRSRFEPSGVNRLRKSVGAQQAQVPVSTSFDLEFKKVCQCTAPKDASVHELWMRFDKIPFVTIYFRSTAPSAIAAINTSINTMTLPPRRVVLRSRTTVSDRSTTTAVLTLDDNNNVEKLDEDGFAASPRE
jgi:hypothetical protein